MFCFSSQQNNNNNALASLPSIGDFSEAPLVVEPPPAPPQTHSDGESNRVDLMSDTSSSSSDSDSDSEGDVTVVAKEQSNGVGAQRPPPPANVRTNFTPQHILNEDLCLSESGSDSD